MIIRIIIFIVLVLLAIVVIASASYSDKPETMVKLTKSKSPIAVAFVRPEMEHNCNILNIRNMNKNLAYLVTGNFVNSCISIYKDGERVHSRRCDGTLSLLFTSNLKLTSYILKETSKKSLLLPLESDANYKVVFSDVNNLEVKNYTINYDIEQRNIVYEYGKGIGTSEYDVYTELAREDLHRVALYPTNTENIWSYKSDERHIVVYFRNLYNLNINLNGDYFSTSKSSFEPEMVVEIVDNCDLTVTNMGHVSRTKDINREYIDFITGPNYLLTKFLYGSKPKEIDYGNQVNNKVFLYKIV
jgi:hypothetical protein